MAWNLLENRDDCAKRHSEKGNSSSGTAADSQYRSCRSLWHKHKEAQGEAFLHLEDKKPEKSVLLVEDHRETRDVLRIVLDLENYHVLEAVNCTEALSRLDLHIDIALVDYRLPDGNGIDLIKGLREMKPLLPVILMSGYGTEDLAVRSFRAGATDYIKKPPEIDYLRGKIAELLGGKVIEDNSGPEFKCNSEDLALDRIANYIKVNHTEDITLDRLAEMAGMCRFSFSRLFKKKFPLEFRQAGRSADRQLAEPGLKL